MEEKFYVTEEGLDELKKQLDELIHVTRNEVIEELKELLKNTMFSFRHPINDSLKENSLPVIVDSSTAYDLLKRPFVELSLIMKFNILIKLNNKKYG